LSSSAAAIECTGAIDPLSELISTHSHEKKVKIEWSKRKFTITPTLVEEASRIIQVFEIRSISV